MFKVTNLGKNISGKVILQNVNFEIEHGQVGIFLGGSGVGKSTLLRILNNLENYDSGTFTLDDQPLNLTEVNRNHTMGMVFQHFNLFENLNVEDNINLALIKLKGMTKNEAQEVSTALLDRYGLLSFAKNRVNRLSGGQKQRLAIARTIALNPKIICLDEPTSALDPRLTGQIAKYIEDLAADNRIVLLATHDIGLIQKLHGKLLLMKKGAILETCLTNEYQDHPSNYPHLQHFLSGHAEVKE